MDARQKQYHARKRGELEIKKKKVVTKAFNKADWTCCGLKMHWKSTSNNKNEISFICSNQFFFSSISFDFTAIGVDHLFMTQCVRAHCTQPQILQIEWFPSGSQAFVRQTKTHVRWALNRAHRKSNQNLLLCRITTMEKGNG